MHCCQHNSPPCLATTQTPPQEYCDQGTLRQALDRGCLLNPRTGRTHLPVALALARDVVRRAVHAGDGGP